VPTAEELAEFAIELAERYKGIASDAHVRYTSAVVGLAERAGYSQGLLLGALEICKQRPDSGNDTAGLAMTLLDEAQSSNLVD
jgi:hypothetical protein